MTANSNFTSVSLNTSHVTVTPYWLSCLLPAATCSDVEGALSNEQASKRLRLFVPAAAEMGRQREAAQLGPKSQLSMVRTALRLGRQVSLFHQTDVQAPQGCHS